MASSASSFTDKKPVPMNILGTDGEAFTILSRGDMKRDGRMRGGNMKKVDTEKRVVAVGARKMNCIVLRPRDRTAAEKPPGILWIHGGGYITGMAGMVYISRALPLVKKYGAVVLSPAYRLAKEAHYPAALEDCYAALLYLKTHADDLGIDSGRIMVGGESAGGGLAVAVCLEARRRGDVNIAFQMPLYPMLDDRDTDSSRDNHGFVWNTKRNHMGWKAYLGDRFGKDIPATAAPARELDHIGLPPAYTFVGKREAFYCETLAYIESLQAAGVKAVCDVYESGMHAFDMLTPFRKISRQAAEAFERQYLYAAEHYRAEQIMYRKADSYAESKTD